MFRTEICCNFGSWFLTKNYSNNYMYGKVTISILLLMFFMVFPNWGYAKGDPELEKLESLLKAASTDNERVKIGIDISNYCLKLNNSKCETYANNAIKLSKKLRLDEQTAALYSIIGVYNYKNNNYKKAVSAFESEYSLWKKHQKAKPRATACYYLGFCYEKLGNSRKAKKYYDEGLSLAQKLGNKDLTESLTRSLSDVSAKQKNYKEAYDYLNRYLRAENKRFQQEFALLQDFSEQQSKLIDEKDSTIEVVENQKEVLKSEKEKLDSIAAAQRVEIQLTTMRNMVLAKEKTVVELQNKILIGSVVSVGVFLILFLMLYFKKKKYNKALLEKNTEIENKNKEINRQNEEIKAKNLEISKSYEVINLKNKDITDSLTYAGKIQKALLRDFANYSSLINDYFIFYAPKDIVSGDFYWAHRVGDKFVFTVGDCTGHSVPGAFMSMLGIALLNQIVAQQQEVVASKILEQMRSSVKTYLGQTGLNEEPKDGMDMSLCVWDMKTGQGNYSGAYNPLWQVRKNEIFTFSAIKCPVGIHARELPFEDYFFKIEKGDRYYMFSDGYSDQFGENSQEKFKMSRFKKLILETSNLSMQEQGDRIARNYYGWKGNFIQIDDVCVLGIEI